jgi:hypothetical protein
LIPNPASGQYPQFQPHMPNMGWTGAGYQSDRCNGDGARSAIANFYRAKSNGPCFF